MTILGVPDGSGFTIGTSSSIAAPSGGATSMDVSLDDMIRQRRTKAAKAGRPSAVDRSVGSGRAKRQASANARRGITDTKKPSRMQIEREANRVARQSDRGKTTTTTAAAAGRGRKAKPEAVVRAKERQDKKRRQEAKKKSSGSSDNVIPPAWIGGTRRPPSKKAVTAAVEAMTDAGFKVPRGMQMVISFAPAPNVDPTKDENRKSYPRNNSRGSGRGGRGGRGRGGGRGGRGGRSRR